MHREYKRFAPFFVFAAGVRLPVCTQARKNRLLVDKKDAPESVGVDPESGEEIPVVTAQPFPSDDDRKRFYDQAYEVSKQETTIHSVQG